MTSMACMRSGNGRKKGQRVLAALFWVLVWQGAAMLLKQPLLLSSPLHVAQRLFTLLGESSFYRALAHSLLRIALGFGSGMILGILLAALSARYRVAAELLRPLMGAVRSVPVASFIILALVWLSSKQLCAFIAFLMVLPIVYGHLLEGLRSRDVHMLEMARVYHIAWFRRLLLIDLVHLRPYLFSAVSLSVGMAWKAGVAAEVIGIPTGSMGEALYQSKIYLDMSALYAWTLVIVLLSRVFEQLVLYLFRRVYERLEEQ